MKKIMLFISIVTVILSCHNRIHAEKLRIYTEEWKPISFSKNGKAKGLGVEVVQEILRRLQIKDNIMVVPWVRGWKYLMNYPNVILFTMTRTKEREKLFTMIGPLVIGTTNFYAKKGNRIKIKNLEEAKKMIIGVYREAVEEQVLKKMGFSNFEITTTPLQSAKQLMDGRIHLWCNANLTVAKTLEDAGYSINDVENVYEIRENHLYIAISKGTQENIVISWKKTLESLKKDGTFNRIYKKWLPGEEPPMKTERIGKLK